MGSGWGERMAEAPRSPVAVYWQGEVGARNACQPPAEPAITVVHPAGPPRPGFRRPGGVTIVGGSYYLYTSAGGGGLSGPRLHRAYLGRCHERNRQ